jgi:hypothetical protein
MDIGSQVQTDAGGSEIEAATKLAGVSLEEKKFSLEKEKEVNRAGEAQQEIKIKEKIANKPAPAAKK